MNGENKLGFVVDTIEDPQAPDINRLKITCEEEQKDNFQSSREEAMLGGEVELREEAMLGGEVELGAGGAGGMMDIEEQEQDRGGNVVTKDQGELSDISITMKAPQEEIEAVRCPHSHQFVDDLSESESEESEITVEGRTQERRERRVRKRRKKQDRLKKCCSGCDIQGNIEPLSPNLPSPISVGTGMLQCNVIKTFDELVDAHHNSEEEINNAIKSYSTVGNRLARVHDTTFSDPDMRTYNRSVCGSPETDPELPVCDFSSAVGRKLANRTGAAGSSSEAGPSTHMPDNLADLPKEKLGKLVKQLSNELIETNEELVKYVKVQDDLKEEKTIYLKHIAELTRMAQGHRVNDGSAFRKIIVTLDSRETDL